jgi:hypothetical protein
MVASEEEHGNTSVRQAADTLRQLTLVGLAGLPIFVRVTAKKNQVNFILNGIINQMVKRGKTIEQACGEACRRVDMPVVLHAKVQVCEMKDFHVQLLTFSFTHSSKIS